MENAIGANLSILQMFLSLAFTLWLIICPIIIIRKLDYLTFLLDSRNSNAEESSEENED